MTSCFLGCFPLIFLEVLAHPFVFLHPFFLNAFFVFLRAGFPDFKDIVQDLRVCYLTTQVFFIFFVLILQFVVITCFAYLQNLHCRFQAFMIHPFDFPFFRRVSAVRFVLAEFTGDVHIWFFFQAFRVQVEGVDTSHVLPVCVVAILQTRFPFRHMILDVLQSRFSVSTHLSYCFGVRL